LQPATRVQAKVQAKILLIEHDAARLESMRQQLRLEGYGAETASDARAALNVCAVQRFDLIVLNLQIPSVGGLSVCRRLRDGAQNRRTPILLITHDAGIREGLTALEQCADDCLVWPFGMREFVARARALMRRSDVREAASPPPVVRERLVIDPARRRVNVEGRDVKLTVHEFQLLYTLAARAGVVFDREALLSEVWGRQTFVTIRSVDALVKRVRRQLDTADPQLDYVVTVRGVGYKFEDAQAST
jgi:DNA-binding response OmpR family regulator